MVSLRALYSAALGMIFCASSTGLLATKENGNDLLAAANAVLETIFGDGADARVLSIQGGDFRRALHACVTAVNADPSNIDYSDKLLKLLQRVVDSRQLLIQFEDAARALLEAGNREAVGILGINLAESMERTRTDVDPYAQEMLLRHSIHAFPEHPIAVVSLGYRLEQRGEELQAMELYREGIARDPGRLDLQLLLASSCSPFLADTDQGEMRFSRVSSEMERLAHDIQMFGTQNFNLSDPGRDIGYMPSFSWQYMGRNMRPLMETLCWTLAAMTVTLHQAPPTLHPGAGWDNRPVTNPHEDRQRAAEEDEGGSERKRAKAIPVASEKAVVGGRITVGVVLERRTNHSPHRLIQSVLEGIDRSRFRLVAFAHEHMVEYPPAGEAVLEAAEEVFVLPWHPFVSGMPDPFAERKIIIMAQVDVLLYMALGNTLGSHLLALGRLAPVQVSFGHGHPVTSGSPGIDYFVSSSLFETKTSVDSREARRFSGTASDVAAATAAADGDGTNTAVGSCVTTSADVDRPLSHCGEVLSRNARAEGNIGDTAWRWGRGDGAQDFTEQLVLFDSLTASLPEMSGPSNAPDIVALEVRALTSGLLREDDHAYHCIQHSKKFHPDFDPVLRGVLLGDAAAKILLAEGSKVHLPRWERTLGPDLIQRLIFLPPLQYPDMLTIVAHCRVMLDTFPWGAGVTSMEALSAGVPVVTLPARISVLNLAAGQLTKLGVGGDLIASDVNSMVKAVVKLASDPLYRERMSAEILSRKGRLSNPDGPVEEWERFLERAVQSAVRGVAPQ